MLPLSETLSQQWRSRKKSPQTSPSLASPPSQVLPHSYTPRARVMANFSRLGVQEQLSQRPQLRSPPNASFFRKVALFRLLRILLRQSRPLQVPPMIPPRRETLPNSNFLIFLVPSAETTHFSRATNPTDGMSSWIIFKSKLLQLTMPSACRGNAGV